MSVMVTVQEINVGLCKLSEKKEVCDYVMPFVHCPEKVRKCLNWETILQTG